MANSNVNAKRFSAVYAREQVEAGINLVGKHRAIAIFGDEIQVYGEQMLLNLNVAMTQATSDDPDFADEVAVLMSLPRLTSAELKASGMEDLYNQGITLGIREESPIGRQIARLHDEGARSVALEILELTAVQRVDQATGQAIAGKWLFNVPIGGIKIHQLNFDVEASKPVAENKVAAAAKVAAAPIPKRDYAAIAAKLDAVKNATASVSATQAAVVPVSTATVMAKMLGLGFPAATAATQAPAIAATISPENWAVASSATDEAAFKALLGAFSIQLA